MAEEEKEEGLKDESGEQPVPEKPEVREDLKTPEETPSEKADRLLRDGTPKDKEIKVNKKTYDEKNDKAKLYEAHAPLLDKVLKNPELVENLLETKEKGDLGERLSALEEERKTAKRREIKEAVTNALSQWPDFEKLWSEIQPITDSLAKVGVPYADALRRGYFAVDPDAAAAEKERLAKEGVNRLGTFSTSTGYSPKPVSMRNAPKLTEGQQKIFGVLKGHSHMPKTEAEYAGLLEKHQGWLDEKFGHF